MDIRSTFSDISPDGDIPLAELQCHGTFGDQRVEFRAGAWCQFDQQPTNYQHHHEGFFEFCLAVAGEGSFIHNQATHPIRPGTLFVSDPTIVHEIQSPSRDLVLIYWMMRCTPSIGSRQPRWEDDAMRRFLDGHEQCRHDQHDLIALAHLLTKQSNNTDDSFRQQNIFQTLALSSCSVLAQQQAMAMQSKPENDRIDALLRLLDADDAHLLSVGAVADHIGISERQLPRLVKEHLGTTVVQLMSRRKFNRAAQHLLMGMTVSEAAATVGIIDSSQFFRQFRKQFHCSPKQYVKERLASAPQALTWHI